MCVRLLLSVSEVNLTDRSSLFVQSTGGLGTLVLLLRSRMGQGVIGGTRSSSHSLLVFLPTA